MTGVEIKGTPFDFCPSDFPDHESLPIEVFLIITVLTSVTSFMFPFDPL